MSVEACKSDLELLERTITTNNIEAVASDIARPDDIRRPEVAALLDSAASMVAVLSERDALREEVAFLRQQLAASLDRCAQLEHTLGEALSQRDYFRAACDGLSETIEAANRCTERGLMIIRQAYTERHRQERKADDMLASPGNSASASLINLKEMRGAPMRPRRSGGAS